MTRKWFLTMREMFLGSEMMFDMIRNYFRVKSDKFGRFWSILGLDCLGGAVMTNILRLRH